MKNILITGGAGFIGPNFMENITQDEDLLENYAIHESQNAYNAVLTPEKWVLRGENAVFWSDSLIKTNT